MAGLVAGHALRIAHAVPVLRTINHDRFLCQYELEKAIRKCEGELMASWERVH